MTEKRFMKIFLCLASLCTAPLLLGPAMLCPAGRAAPAAQRAAVQRAAPATQESARALGGGEAAAPWPEGVLQLRQQAVCGADGLYTVTLEAWAAGAAAGRRLARRGGGARLHADRRACLWPRYRRPCLCDRQDPQRLGGRQAGMPGPAHRRRRAGRHAARERV